MNLDKLKAVDLPRFLGTHYALAVSGTGAARCPFHDDKTASLSVQQKNGVGVFKCHACGAAGTIIDWVMRFDALDFKEAVGRIVALEGIPEDAAAASAKPKIEIRRTHTYTDEAGQELWQKVKLSDGTFRCRRKGPDGRWIYNLEGVRRVPYRLDKIKDSPAVVVCEGERDADTMAELGFPATSGPSGKDSWPDEITPIFAGKEIRILYDVGQDAAALAVAAKLAPVAKTVAILKVPLEQHEADITDYLEPVEGQDAKRDAVYGILAAEQPFELPAEAKPAPQGPLISFPELRLMEIHVDWLVEDLLPENSVTFFYGRTTVGKTWAALAMAEAVASGLSVFGKATKKKNVVYVDAENPLANMKERADTLNMRAMNAQLWHSTRIPPPPKLDGPAWELYKTIIPPESMVIFDTRRALTDGKENDDDAAALVMTRCKELRDQARTILILSHPTKANERDLRGSGVWADLADHTIQFYKVKRLGQTEEDEGGEILPGSLLCLATGKKTRYAPAIPTYLTLTESGLELAQDPKTLELNAIAQIIAGDGFGKGKNEVAKLAREARIGPRNKQAFFDLLNRGSKEGRWRVESGLRGTQLHYPIEGERS